VHANKGSASYVIEYIWTERRALKYINYTMLNCVLKRL